MDSNIDKKNTEILKNNDMKRDEKEISNNLKLSDNKNEDSKILKDYYEFLNSFFVLSEYMDDEKKIKFQTYYRKSKSKKDVLLFCVHGAGSSSTSFAELAKSLKAKNESIGIFLFDMRGHGGSSHTTDFSIDLLIKDLEFVSNTFFLKNKIENPIYFFGHSLGGAVILKYLQQQKNIPVQIEGVIMLDMFGEISTKSFMKMKRFINKRPESFSSLSNAIKWHLNTILHNEESARLSVPSLLNLNNFTWKTDLKSTEPFWKYWFENITQCFLSYQGNKLLILSEQIDLNKELIIEQMQGKFKLIVPKNIIDCGHFIHENDPENVSCYISDFFNRNENFKKIINNMRK